MCVKLYVVYCVLLLSFGTDSPLDLDVKDRLMSQVLPVLAALPDDEAAFHLHHKREAARRLQAKRQPAPTTPSKPVRVAVKKPIVDPKLATAGTASGEEEEGAVTSTNQEDGRQTPDESAKEEEEPEQAEEGTEVDPDSEDEGDPVEGQNYAFTVEQALSLEAEEVPHTLLDGLKALDIGASSPSSTEPTSTAVDPDASSPTHADPSTHATSAARLEEIRAALFAIYEVCSPEKVGKIDKLLAKYKVSFPSLPWYNMYILHNLYCMYVYRGERRSSWSLCM